MTHEKTIKRDDGSSVQIVVTFFEDFGRVTYRVDNVYTKEKGKRTWNNAHSTDDFSWRRLNAKEREEYKSDVFKKYVTDEEIQQAKNELWEKLKP
jgi:hypothetical protein